MLSVRPSSPSLSPSPSSLDSSGSDPLVAQRPPFRRALISVSDKRGLSDFLMAIRAKEFTLVSTGGTAQYLRSQGFQVQDVSDQTGFPEVMGGRVKTLHPRIHMAILARSGNEEDLKLLEDQDLEPFDLVVGNLYPFEESLSKDLGFQELIEKIDIGGPTLLRAAAKNFQQITVVCNPQDYALVSSIVVQTGAPPPLREREKLAAKVFYHVSYYDACIGSVLNQGLVRETPTPRDKLMSEMDSSKTRLFPSLDLNEYTFGGRRQALPLLRYGENPQQGGLLLRSPGVRRGQGLGSERGQELLSAEVLHGKPLSYNNWLDLEAATGLIRGLQKLKGWEGREEGRMKMALAVVVKHNNPCGVCAGELELSSTSTTLARALAADPMSSFGGVVACNQKIGASEAQALQSVFLECLICPDYTLEALEILKKKKNLRILQWPTLTEPEDQDFIVPEIRSISGGFLLQSPPTYGSEISTWIYFDPKSQKPLPFASLLEDRDSLALPRVRDLQLAESVAASLKSNAIALVSQGQTVGLGMGQVNRVDAVVQAGERVRRFHSQVTTPLVLASDAFFPFPDSIEIASKFGVQWVLEPGGSVKDAEVIAAASDRGLHLVFTGCRHFRH